MPRTEWYKDWFSSPYYHKLYFERGEEEARRFIGNLVRHLAPAPGSHLLDVGCGRGRHSRMLAEAGYEVTGIDLSFASIRHTLQYESEALHFYQHDMRLPFWVNYFDYAFSFFTSFGYFHTRREHDDSMRSIAGSVRRGGFVLFDYLNTHYAEDHLVHNEWKEIGATRFEIHRWHDEHHFYKRIIITDPALEQPEEHTEKLAKFSLGDFTDMLSFQKLQVTEVFGDYNLGSYDVRKTPRLIVLARK
jgi:SAM-dependent methyltransferase